MILFTILLITLILLIAITIVIASIFGASFIVVFGDVIVCAVLIVWIIKKMIKGKKHRG